MGEAVSSQAGPAPPPNGFGYVLASEESDYWA